MAIDSKLARPGVAPIAAAVLLALAQPVDRAAAGILE